MQTYNIDFTLKLQKFYDNTIEEIYIFKGTLCYFVIIGIYNPKIKSVDKGLICVRVRRGTTTREDTILKYSKNPEQE